MSTEPLILLERHRLGRGSAVAAVLTLNRPDQLNPIDAPSLVELDRLLDEIEGDKHVRAVLVTGAGRAFSAGGDMKKYVALQKDPSRSLGSLLTCTASSGVSAPCGCRRWPSSTV